VVIAAKNRRIKELEDGNKSLKQELQKLREKLYESLG
jgi:chaperonin cofactor prefoldin